MENRTPITLCMMVKNESAIIERCLASIADHIDSWLIHDTGSTDGTQDKIQHFFETRQIPGKLVSVPWKDYGWNRSQLLQNAQKLPGYLLLADADYQFTVSPEFRKQPLTAHAYYIAWTGSTFYRNLKLVRADLPWGYVGRTHEYIEVSPKPDNYHTAHIDSIKITEYGDGGNRATKFARDLELLTLDLKDNPKNMRSMFYLARTHEDIGNTDEALSWYRKRVDAGGWFEERYYAQYKVGVCLIKKLAPVEQIAAELTKAAAYDPLRCEAAHTLVRWCRENKQEKLGMRVGLGYLDLPMPTDRLLFLEPAVYAWRLKDEISICAYYAGEYEFSRKLCKELLSDASALPKSERIRVQKNLDFSESAIKKAPRVSAKKTANLFFAESTSAHSSLPENFTLLQGVALPTDPAVISPKMVSAISNGTYEAAEAAKIPRILTAGERVLELGAGIGYLSALCAKDAKTEAVLAVEANPALIPLIEKTYSANGVTKAKVLLGVAQRGKSQTTLPFYVREDFWASSLSPTPLKFVREVQVPTIDLPTTMTEFKPTLLIVDIEGGELELLPALALDSVKHVLIEIHESEIGQPGVDRIFSFFAENGFSYDLWNSAYAVLHFKRRA